MATKTAKKAAKKAAPAVKYTTEKPPVSLKPHQLDALAVLFTTNRNTTPEELGTDEKGAKKLMAPLIDKGMATVNAKGQYRFQGVRVAKLADLLDTMRTIGGELTVGEIAEALWGDAKRFIAPAGAVLKGAFEVGAIKRHTAEGAQPKYSLA